MHKVKKHKYIVDFSFQLEVEAESKVDAEDVASELITNGDLILPDEYLEGTLQISRVPWSREEEEYEPE